MKLLRTKNEQTCADGALSFKLMALMTVAFGALAVTLQAADPGWWSGVVLSNNAPNAVVTQGQLKFFTARAVAQLNTNLPGGAGTALNNMVSNWAADYATNGYSTNLANPARPYKPSDYQVVNQGQLKYIANLVWGQLVTGGYTNVAPSWLAANTNTDNQVVNQGQLKTVFDFDLTESDADSNTESIPNTDAFADTNSDAGSIPVAYTKSFADVNSDANADYYIADADTNTNSDCIAYTTSIADTTSALRADRFRG